MQNDQSGPRGRVKLTSVVLTTLILIGMKSAAEAAVSPFQSSFDDDAALTAVPKEKVL